MKAAWSVRAIAVHIDRSPSVVSREVRRNWLKTRGYRRLHLEARDDSFGLMNASTPAQGRTVSHEAIYRFIYALPEGELAKHGVLLQSKRTRRRRPRPGTARRLESGPDPTAHTHLAQHARLPTGHWNGERAATDILVLAAKGKAFGSLDKLLVRQGGHQVLPGSALVLAAATRA